ncbi:hypothetical protein ENSA7_09430 [Enhygromyxa salina]|uniref:Uncharacterized protein n=1 Tax=Enhygromyxa salina TaxID=215803 RepID=A0A2S9YW95_9BACT|nr:hypothetical protein ENSA7_09430 [Enhygromyxa salina]
MTLRPDGSLVRHGSLPIREINPPGKEHGPAKVCATKICMSYVCTCEIGAT